MPRYEIIIYWSQADEAFIAEVPELPGCASCNFSPADLPYAVYGDSPQK